MKDTGIVRRIDELGRIVIPKEIRRSMRLRVGTPVEIAITKSGEILLSKYSPLLEMKDFAESVAQSIYENLDKNTIVCNGDHIVAASGMNKKEYLNLPASHEISDMLEERRSYILNSSENAKMLKLKENDDNTYTSQIIVPIIASSDVIGAIVVFSRDELVKFTAAEAKVVNTMANFLAKFME